MVEPKGNATDAPMSMLVIENVCVRGDCIQLKSFLKRICILSIFVTHLEFIIKIYTSS